MKAYTQKARDMRLTLKWLIFISAALVLLLFASLTSQPPIQIIAIHVVNEQAQTNLNDVGSKCSSVFSAMFNLHSSFGRQSPHELKMLLNKQKTSLTIRNEWIIDQEYIDMHKQSSSKLIVTNKDLNEIIERIIAKQEYNSYGDFNLEKV